MNYYQFLFSDTTGGVKVVLYMAFMVIMIKVHTFPLFAIRPMYLSMRWAIMLYHHAAINMYQCFTQLLIVFSLWCVLLHFLIAGDSRKLYMMSSCLEEQSEIWISCKWKFQTFILLYVNDMMLSGALIISAHITVY